MRRARATHRRWMVLGLAATFVLVLVGCERSGDVEATEGDGTASPAPANDLPKPDVSRLSVGLQNRLEAMRAETVQNPTNASAFGLTGAIYYVQGIPRAAVQYFEHAAKLEPDKVDWHYYAAIAHQDIGNQADARRELERVLELDPGYVPAYVKLAGLVVNEDREQAKTLCEKALELNANDPAANLAYGLVLGALGDANAAGEWFDKALALKPDYREALMAKARLLKQQNKPEEAVRYAKAAELGNTPTTGDPLLRRLLRSGLRMDILLSDALQLSGQGLHDKAAEVVDLAELVDPDGWAVQRVKGIVAVAAGRYEEAVEAFTEASLAQPEMTEIKARLAEALAELGRNEQAEALFKELLQANPNDLSTLQLYANLLQKVGRTDEAIKLLEEYATRNPNDATAIYILGAFHYDAGEYDRAAEHFESCLALAPEHMLSQYFLGQIAYHKKDFDAAKQRWEALVQSMPTFVDPRLALARLAEQQGDLKAARAYLQDGVEAMPESTQLLNALAWLLATAPDAALRDGQQAVKLASRACELTNNQSHQMLDTLAAAQAEAGDFAAAAETAAAAANLAEKSGETEAAAGHRERMELYKAKKPYHRD